MSSKTDRWSAVILYRSGPGLDDRHHEFEEISDLHDIVEKGPHFDTIEQITIRRINPIHPDLTIEEALEL